MYVCMYVRNEFAIEIYGFMHSLHTSSARAVHDVIMMEVEDSEDTARGLRRYLVVFHPFVFC